MSLMRLLSAGRSLVGIEDHTSRYRMGKPGMLPKFGSAKNPFGSRPLPAQSAPVVEPGSTPVLPSPVSATNGSVSTATSNPGPSHLRENGAPPEAAQEQACTTQVSKPAVSRVTKPAGKPGDLPTWQSAIRQVWKPALLRRLAQSVGSRFGSRAKAPNPARRPSETAVQGELSLDQVKVVRNDLSDSDVEVVSSRGQALIGHAMQPKKRIETAVKTGAPGYADKERRHWFSGRLHGLRRWQREMVGTPRTKNEPTLAAATAEPPNRSWLSPG